MPNITYGRNFPDEADAICIGHNYLLAASARLSKTNKSRSAEGKNERKHPELNQSISLSEAALHRPRGIVIDEIN